jgi:hypothetical protein
MTLVVHDYSSGQVRGLKRRLFRAHSWKSFTSNHFAVGALAETGFAPSQSGMLESSQIGFGSGHRAAISSPRLRSAKPDRSGTQPDGEAKTLGEAGHSASAARGAARVSGAIVEAHPGDIGQSIHAVRRPGSYRGAFLFADRAESAWKTARKSGRESAGKCGEITGRMSER